METMFTKSGKNMKYDHANSIMLCAINILYTMTAYVLYVVEISDTKIAVINTS